MPRVTSRRRQLAFTAALAATLVAGLGDVLRADAPSAAPPPRAAPAAPKPVDPGRIRDAVRKLVGDVKGWGGTAGVMVLDLENGQTLAANDEGALLNPASNAKLVTAAAALRTLGSSHRYLTGLYGKVSDGTV